MTLHGVVGSGKQYDSQVRKWGGAQLPFAPYHGTLNVGFTPSLTRDFIDTLEPLHPFKDFVGVWGKIRGVRVLCCYSIHGSELVNTFYIIAEQHLRTLLGLVDGDRIEVEI